MIGKKRSQVTQVAPLLVEAIEPQPIGAQPVDTASAESIARRIRRRLPYSIDMLAHLFVRRGVVARRLPELDPYAGQRAALKRALERLERGESDPPLPVDADAMLRDLSEWRERRRQIFDEIAYGAFLADFWAARNETLLEEVRAAATERLVPVLRPDKTTRQNRLFPAADRRWRRDQPGGTAGQLLEREIRIAIHEAIATAETPRDGVYLPLSGKNEKYTRAQDGEPIVPAHDLREPDLRHALKAIVTRLVDREFQSEIADLKAIKAASKAPWAVETPSDPQQLQARRVDLADLWAWGNAQARDVFGANHSERTPRTRSGARKAQPETPLGVSLVDDGAHVCLFCGRAPDKHDDRHVFTHSERARGHAARIGHVVDTDGQTFSIEALHGVGVKGLEALEAEERIRPQRAAKVEEIKRLATPQQRALIEAMLTKGYSSDEQWKDLAGHLGKREPAVRKLFRELVAKVEYADVEPPRWTRPPLPPREIRGGTVPAHVFSTEPIQRNIGFGFVATANQPWPCALPTHGFSSSSQAEGFLKPRNGVPA